MRVPGLRRIAAARTGAPGDGDNYKWWAFSAIAISFVTQVMSISMVFVALAAIADDFGVTLREVSWVVVAQALTISALMMPMGRLADIVGWKRIHVLGLLLFCLGAVATVLAPTFGALILARVVMATGNSMGQAVGTAMVVSVFPPAERGKAIGAQATAVSIGGASGPVAGGLVLQWLPWEALFLIVLVPATSALVWGYLILDDRRMNQPRGGRAPFDYPGALLSAAAIALLVLTMNNPLRLGWTSPLMLGSLATVALLLAGFARRELRAEAPMLELRLFRNAVFSMAVLARLSGFIAMTVSRFLMPIYLISLRGLEEAAAGGVLFLTSLGMGIAAQGSGRLADRFGPRPFAVAGFAASLLATLPMAFLDGDSSLIAVMLLLFGVGLGMGLWSVPNNSIIMGSVTPARMGVVSALTNLTRNVGNVTGQAMAAGVVVAVMAAGGFDVPLSEIADSPGAARSFIDGWRWAYALAAAFSIAALALAFRTRPAFDLARR